MLNVITRKNLDEKIPSFHCLTIQNVPSPFIRFRLNLTFASKKVFTDFIITSLLVVILPVVFVAVANSYVKDRTDIGELMKIVIVAGPAVVFINVVIGFYIYKAIKDP